MIRLRSSRARRRTVVALVAVPALVLAAFLAPAAAQVTTPTTTTTTTTPSTSTTTTAPATTTTTTPATTTSSSTSTSSTSTTSTTVAAVVEESDDGVSLGLILAILAAIALIALIAALVIRAQQRKKNLAQWLVIARPARDNAVMARDLMASSTTERGAATGAAVTAQVDAAASDLDRAAAIAPDDERRDAVNAVAAALRGLQFALEAESLLRSGTTQPTAEQLAQADVTHRQRAQELDQALVDLGGLLGEGDQASEGTAPS